MNKEVNNNKWEFIDNKGTFRWINPEAVNEMYLPLCNEAGYMANITPMLHGDSKINQHNFLLTPVTVEDLHNTKSARNFWVYVQGKRAWSATGNSALQNSKRYTEEDNSKRVVEGGLLWHRVNYSEPEFGLASEILSFVPASRDTLEIMQVRITNESNETIKITPTSATPIYGRSAENIRDHRHVTALVNRIEKTENGIILRPEIIFEERGHKYNNTTYFVAGHEDDGTKPVGVFLTNQSYIGSFGGFDWPEAVVKNISPDVFADDNFQGKECPGAIRFKEVELKPGESKTYIMVLGITKDKDSVASIIEKYNNIEKIDMAYKANTEFWANKLGNISFSSGQKEFSMWMKWVALQPILRKVYGCSFLPYHDYGKGGRGWRDLWQDCLALIIQEPKEVRNLLLNNFAGVRIDGTNATIIGTQPGEFLADRNNIPRVWMDHGAWPYLTIKMYIDQSGDFEILTVKQKYFRDRQIFRARRVDEQWTPEYGKNLKTETGEIYEGTVLEHMLIQHLSIFFNVGEHNIMRLEGGDWNDTLDMARQKGESTAFTALYGSNLISLANLLQEYKKLTGSHDVELFEEIIILMDSLARNVAYNSVEYKNTLLDGYFKKVSSTISGKTINVNIDELSKDLIKKGEWIFNHLKSNEWIETGDGNGYFNGYYNNDGNRVDGQFDGDVVRMSLTAQVFTTMSGLATDEQVKKIYAACNKYLKDPDTGGYRLNTPLGENKLNLGRGFAFAYGEKENGAIFCHMVVMYMNGLYKRGFVKEGFEVFNSLYNLAMDTKKSKIYPGIPEYFRGKDGKGMYHYVTGSGSWLLLTVLNEMFGVRGELGDVVLEPKLEPAQFDGEGVAEVNTIILDKNINVKYINKDNLSYSQYKIDKVEINSGNLPLNCILGKSVKINSDTFKTLCCKERNNINVYLTRVMHL